MDMCDCINSHHVCTCRYVVATAGPQLLTIERVQGLQLSSAVIYHTVQPSQAVTVGQLTFEPAQSTMHFTEINDNIVTFDVNQVGHVTTWEAIGQSIPFCLSLSLLIFLSHTHIHIREMQPLLSTL